MTAPDSVAGATLPLRSYLRRLIGLSLLPMVALALYLAFDNVSKARAADDRASARLAREIAGTLDHALQARMDALTALSMSPLLDDTSRLPDFYRAAQSIRRTFGSDVILADAEGQMLLHTGRPFGAALPVLPRPKGAAAVPQALASGRAAAGDSFIGPLADRRLVAVAVPVRRSGKPDQVLVSILDVQQLQRWIDPHGLPPGWSVTVVDGRQERLAALPASASASSPGADGGGARQTVALQQSGWTVELVQSAQSRNAPLFDAVRLLMLAIVAATGTGWLVGAWGSRRLARSVASLTGDAPEGDAAPVTEIAQARQRLIESAHAREAATAALRDSEATFRAVFDGLADAAVLTDAERRVRWVNPAFCRQFRFSADDVVGQSTALMYADPSDYERLGRTRFGPDVTPGGAVYEVQYRRGDGSTFWAESTSVRVLDDQGRVLCLFALHRDITQRLQSQQQLEQQQEQLEEQVASRTADLERANEVLAARAQTISDLYDHAPCGYHSVSADGTVLTVNETELAMLGYARDDYVGRPIGTFVSPDSRAHQKDRLDELLRTGRLREAELDFVRKDGSLLPVLVSADLVRDAAGQVVSSRSTMVDNSDRKARDQQIAEMQLELARRADLAEAATRAKSAFLANMSHEIRTPMNAIIGLSHLMARDVSDATQRDRLRKIDGAAQHLLQVINDILDLSKIEAGKMVLEDTEFSLDDLLSRAIEMVNGPAQDKGLELVLDTDHLPARMRGDPTRLSQALINLLSNAVKFTEHGWVRLRGQLLQDDGPRLQVRFEVQDTGPGIEPERQALLFAPFEQADGTATRRHGGTGLGLALTRHLARLMGGEAGIDSAPGLGSTFWFTGWLGRAIEPAAPAAPTVLRGLRALLVDDLPEARAALADRLQALGLVVDEQPDGAAALSHLQAEAAAGRAFDLLLLDWRMQPLDGIETLIALRGILGDGVPPSLLVTAFNEPVMWQQARDARFDAVLVKPVTASALHDALLRVLRRQGGVATLPPPLPGQAEALLRRRHSGRRVLLAEDNPVNREVAEELLHSVGLLVETADNGRLAVEMALGGSHDLILMDMQMPEMDGLAATRAVRQRIERAVPIVAMTANAFGEDRQACLDAGMNDHVAKPVDPEALYAALLRWLPAPVDPEATGDRLRTGALQASLIERLAAIDGLDAPRALDLMGGHDKMLARVLRRFVQTYRDGEPVLRDASSPVARRRAACHSLRGACAAVAADPLQRRVAAFEQAGLEGPASVDTGLELDADLRQLVARIDAALGP